MAAMMRTLHCDRAVAADALERAFLQHPQELHLHGEAHVADLIEEERAALGEFEASLAGGERAREGALLVAEEFALEQIRRDRPAIDRHERVRGALRELVDVARDQFLARAGLAEQQHVAVERGDLADQSMNRRSSACGRPTGQKPRQRYERRTGARRPRTAAGRWSAAANESGSSSCRRGSVSPAELAVRGSPRRSPRRPMRTRAAERRRSCAGAPADCAIDADELPAPSITASQSSCSGCGQSMAVMSETTIG